VSVFPTLEGLYRYMAEKGTEADGSMIVELEAMRADDLDFDADQGAMLVIPAAIVSSTPADRRAAERAGQPRATRSR
jgi:hypothetical protein